MMWLVCAVTIVLVVAVNEFDDGTKISAVLVPLPPWIEKPA